MQYLPVSDGRTCTLSTHSATKVMIRSMTLVQYMYYSDLIGKQYKIILEALNIVKVDSFHALVSSYHSMAHNIMA